MKCGHLFNGIGGFALAAHWMGWENIMHCEIDPFCNKIMNHHFPNSYQHEDIRTTDFTIWRGRIDLLTGGFPCQPYSAAGKRQGTADDRHLWPEMLRAIREIQPTWIVPENVRGLTNWSKGMVFEQVQTEMEIEGYEVVPFLLPAAGVNAPHERYRVWFVAHRIGEFCGKKGGPQETCYHKRQSCEYVKEGREIWNQSASVSQCGDVANPQGDLLERDGTSGINAAKRRENEGRQPCKFTLNDWSIWPTQPPVCNRNDGFPGGLVDITFSKWRNESLKALGNAIVPQVAFQIFKAIDQYKSTS